MVEIYQNQDKYVLKEQYGDVVFSVECQEIEEGLKKLEEAKKNKDLLFDGKEEYEKPHPITIAQWIREYRNQLLADSDWTQLPDVLLEKEEKEKWLKYRKELRDIPKLWGIDENNPRINLSWIRRREDVKKLPWIRFDTIK